AVWHAARGRLPGDWDAEDEVVALAWSSDGTIAAARAGGELYTWRPGDSPAPVPQKSLSVTALAWQPGAPRLAMGGAGSVLLWDVQACREVWQAPALGRGVRHLAWRSDGRRLAAAGSALTVLDAVSGRTLAVYGTNAEVAALCWSVDGASLRLAEARG